MWFTTRWEQAFYDDQDALVEEERVVVVEAESVEDAQRLSGLVVENFREADEDELDDWDEQALLPLSSRDLRMLCSLIAADLREIARKRRRDRDTGRWPDDADDAFDRNRARAFRLACMGAKLEVMLQAAEQREADEASVS